MSNILVAKAFLWWIEGQGIATTTRAENDDGEALLQNDKDTKDHSTVKISFSVWFWAVMGLKPSKERQKHFIWRLLIQNIFLQWLKLSTVKAMAPHSSTLAWKIPWMEEPDRLQSMGSLRVRHDWATSLSLFTFMYWRRKWQPTPVFLPGESQGRGNLLGCHLRGRTESDTPEAT